MSTSYMCQEVLERTAAKHGFDFVEIRLSPKEEMTAAFLAEIPPKEYRLIKNGAVAFLGTADRCSDFLTGFARGAGLQVEIAVGMGDR